jgi:hypothetical protein
VTRGSQPLYAELGTCDLTNPIGSPTVTHRVISGVGSAEAARAPWVPCWLSLCPLGWLQVGQARQVQLQWHVRPPCKKTTTRGLVAQIGCYLTLKLGALQEGHFALPTDAPLPPEQLPWLPTDPPSHLLTTQGPWCALVQGQLLPMGRAAVV